MKKILFLILLFIGTNYAQINRSNWNSAKIDAWAIPPGGFIGNGTDQYYSIPDNDDLDFGVGDFSVGMIIIPKNIGSTYVLMRKGTTINYSLQLYSDSKIRAVINDGSVPTVVPGNSVLVANTLCLIFATFDRGGNCSIYINGVLDKVQDITASNLTLNNVENLFIGSLGGASNYFDGAIIDVGLYNHALTQAEVTKAWNNGQPHLAEIEYKYKCANQTALTSGALVIGKEYIIDTFVAGDDFVNVGGTNVTGNVFIATGTTPTTWTNSSSLRHQGEVLNIPCDRWGTNGAIDISGNELHANSSGSPIAVMGDRDIRSAVGADYVLTNTAKLGVILKYVIITNNTATSQDIDLGTSAGGTQIINDQTIAGNSTVTVSVGDYFGTLTTLYIDDGTSGWVSNVDMQLIYELR